MSKPAPKPDPSPSHSSETANWAEAQPESSAFSGKSVGQAFAWPFTGASVLENWHLLVLPGLVALMLWMVTSLLWPQPQAALTLKPLSADALRESSNNLLDADSSASDISEESALSVDGQASVGNATEITKSSKNKRTHASSRAKKSDHPPVTNLNTATLNQLQRLPGIGPKMAQRIVEYRKAHGTFTTPEQIMDVKGIGEKKFEKLKPFLKV